MNCPNCAAPMRLVRDRDYFVCDYCGTFHFPESSDEGVRLLGEGAGIDCPVCGTELEAASVEGHLARACPNCRGMLLRQRAFSVVMTQRRAAAAAGPRAPARPIEPEERARRIDCPICGAPMDNHPYLGPGAVMVDTCGGCGLIWLDHGELTVVEHA